MKTKLLYSSALIISGIFASGMLNAETTTYTLDADFASGTVNGVNYDAPNSNQLQINTTGTTFPYLWIANAGEASVSKINTDGDNGNGCEEARYFTWYGDPNNKRALGGWSGAAPSRTAVDVDGNVYVANRHYNDNEIPDLIKIAVDGGIDRNGNGVIDTSSDLNGNCVIDPDEMLPVTDANNNGVLDIDDFQDERVVWVRQFGTTNSLGRAVCLDPDGNIWAGTFSGPQAYYKFDPNGNLLTGPVATGTSNYGCAIDSDGILWGATLSTPLLRLDTNTLTVNTYYGSGNYGIALGERRVYLGSTLRAFDRVTNTFDSGITSGGNGVAVDGDGNVWFGSTTLYKYATDSEGRINTPALCSVYNPYGSAARGPIIDKDGHAWTINLNYDSVSQYDTNCNLISVVPVGDAPYTYSDATGFGQRSFTDPTGIWTVTKDSGSDDTEWDLISWNSEAEGNVPGDASITVTARSANAEVNLGSATYTTVSNNTSGLGLTGRYIQIRTVLRPSSGDVSPVLSDLSVTSVDNISCDVDGNGQVDKLDIRLIGSHRNEYVPPGDPMYDIDGDGVISVNDARQCVLMCTNARCAQ